jgi:energy-converting hydrogenase Eha subunit C
MHVSSIVLNIGSMTAVIKKPIDKIIGSKQIALLAGGFAERV